jgi:hypothetical protein
METRYLKGVLWEHAKVAWIFRFGPADTDQMQMILTRESRIAHVGDSVDGARKAPGATA